jgi:hypothetical protein
MATLTGLEVEIGCPLVPLASVVRERPERAAESFVARPAERRVPVLAGLDRDRRLPGIGSDRVAVGVAGAAVTDLSQQGRGAHDRCAGPEQAAEDLPVGVSLELIGDL